VTTPDPQVRAFWDGQFGCRGKAGYEPRGRREGLKQEVGVAGAGAGARTDDSWREREREERTDQRKTRGIGGFQDKLN
jgi:hypothetical protein